MIDLPDGQQWVFDMINNILIEVLSSIAEQERLTIKQRQAEGIAVAKEKGIHLGRPRIGISSKLGRSLSAMERETSHCSCSNGHAWSEKKHIL